MSNANEVNNKGGKRMAILTAKCDKPFIVSELKTNMFKNEKRNNVAFEKINASVEKLSKHLTIELDKK